MYSGKSSAMRPFNSRPHEEVDRYEPVTCCIICLSIHDLTRRSTTRCLRGGRKFILSIHDLTRRSTPVYNPVSEAVQLSIHDLTRRSTLSCLWHLLTRNLSIHDLTRRSTVCHLHADFRGYFQFTTSRAGRPHRTPPLRHGRPFNSRPHEEVDRLPSSCRLSGLLSIHDLTRRSTILYTPIAARQTFQFTTSRGGRQEIRRIV